MFDRDLADSAAASYWPDNSGVVDSFTDRVCQVIEDEYARGKAALMKALRPLLEEGSDGEQSPKVDRAMLQFEIRRTIYMDTRLPIEARLQAVADGIAAGDPYFPHPYQYYADQFGRTRACVHSLARKTQRCLDLRARRDKCPSAREQSREAASAPRTERIKRARHTRPALTWFPGI